MSCYGGKNFRVDKPAGGDTQLDEEGFQIKTTTFHMGKSEDDGEKEEEISLSIRVKMPDLKSDRGEV